MRMRLCLRHKAEKKLMLIPRSVFGWLALNSVLIIFLFHALVTFDTLDALVKLTPTIAWNGRDHTMVWSFHA